MNIDLIRGDTLNIQFKIESSIIIHVDNENFEATFSVKQAATNNSYIFQKSKTSVTEIADNTFVMRIAPEDTESLIPGFYYYDLQLNIFDDVYTIMLGHLQIIRDITLPPSELPVFVYPDVNGDGTVDESDASAILEAYMAISTGQDPGLTPEQQDAADANRDGLITAEDASLVLKFIADCASGKYSNDASGWTEFMSIQYSLQG